MFSKTTPHTFNLEHYQNPDSGLTTKKSNTLESVFPILMILVGIIGVVMMVQSA